MDDKTKKVLEDLEKAINCGEFEKYFEKEKRIIDHLDGKVKRMMDGVEITPELEFRLINWYIVHKTRTNKIPNLWWSLLNVIVEEGETNYEKDSEDNNQIIPTIEWRGYTFKQYWTGKSLQIVIYRGNDELLIL